MAELGRILSPPQLARCRVKGYTAQDRGPPRPSPHTRQGLHSERSVSPLAAKGSNEATVRLHDTSVQEAGEAIKGQHIAQLQGYKAED